MTGSLILALALAMDAFAVALTQGARFRPSITVSLQIALAFGIAQGVMPLIGWTAGTAAFAYIAAVDHWIAFALLAFLGTQMIMASKDDREARKLAGMSLFMASIATSIDALAAGTALPTLNLSPLPTAGLIAVVTFALSMVGIAIGKVADIRLGRPAEVLGGVILVALGTKILLEHTGLI